MGHTASFCPGTHQGGASETQRLLRSLSGDPLAPESLGLSMEMEAIRLASCQPSRRTWGGRQVVGAGANLSPEPEKCWSSNDTETRVSLGKP